MITIDLLVPEKNHVVRKLGAAIDFSIINPLVEHLYSALVRPSIHPEVLIKMTFAYKRSKRNMRAGKSQSNDPLQF